ncbi:hypothetical protein NQ317_002471 [Molorchus minor]|uniref:Uncharacterized protein n=1 Tax=Molorchus minor TaxID=1323400 RepID=A0ABQ9JH25_9CUCU|nr:hypothetical protein NQ317_002471 [Molorchus minor]
MDVPFRISRDILKGVNNTVFLLGVMPKEAKKRRFYRKLNGLNKNCESLIKKRIMVDNICNYYDSFNVTENKSEKLLKAYLRRAKERSEAKKRDKLVPNGPEFKVLCPLRKIFLTRAEPAVNGGVTKARYKNSERLRDILTTVSEIPSDLFSLRDKVMCRRRLSVIIYFFRRRRSYWVFLASLKDHAGPFRSSRYANLARGGRIKFMMTVSRCALCRLCLDQWSTAELRLSAENGYLRFFTFPRPRQGNRGLLTVPKFIVGPFRSFGYANLTCNARPNLATSISRLAGKN